MAEVIKDLINSGVGLAIAEKKGKNASKNAKRAEADYWKRIDAANWEPEYAADHAPQFQKSQSPVARAYLESFLTGTNPAMVQGTALGSGQATAQATHDFNNRYGGWDKLQQKQNEVSADSSHYEVKPFTRKVREEEKEMTLHYPWAEQYEKKLGRKLTPEEAARLAVVRDKGKKLTFGGNALETKMRTGSVTADQLNKYLKDQGVVV
jgi:hypothetical protein